MIRFQVQGDPKGQPRPRAFARRMGDKFVARVFEAGTAEGWKSLIASEARVYAPEQPISGPVSVRLIFSFRRPQSHFRTGKNAGELRPDAPYYHTSKPDNDNLEKAVFDALTQIGLFWDDDKQIVHNETVKIYGKAGGVVIEIKPMAIPRPGEPKSVVVSTLEDQG